MRHVAWKQKLINHEPAFYDWYMLTREYNRAAK